MNSMFNLPSILTRYLVMFSSAFPLAPVIFCIYNFVEMKLDIVEYTSNVTRGFGERVNGIGAWLGIFEFLSIISAVVNCFTIVVVSKNLHEVAYIGGSAISGASLCFGSTRGESVVNESAYRILSSAGADLIPSDENNTSNQCIDCLTKTMPQFNSYANTWCLTGMVVIMMVVLFEHVLVVLKLVLRIYIEDMPPWVRKFSHSSQQFVASSAQSSPTKQTRASQKADKQKANSAQSHQLGNIVNMMMRRKNS